MKFSVVSDKYSLSSNLCKKTCCSSCTFLLLPRREHSPTAGWIFTSFFILIILSATLQVGCEISSGRDIMCIYAKIPSYSWPSTPNGIADCWHRKQYQNMSGNDASSFCPFSLHSPTAVWSLQVRMNEPCLAYKSRCLSP